MGTKFVTKLKYEDEEDDENISVRDKIINQKHREIADRPEFGTKFHYADQREEYERYNFEIMEAFNAGRRYHIDIDISDAKRLRIGSNSHFVAQIGEKIVGNYLCDKMYETGVPPQFSLNTFDRGKDILLGDKTVEVKVETPVFTANGVGYNLDQKPKILSSDFLYTFMIGSSDGVRNWSCGVLWMFEPKTIPDYIWGTYPIGPKGRPHWRFGMYMGESADNFTPWAKPVAVPSQELHDVCAKYGGSKFYRAGKYGKMAGVSNFKDTIIPWEAFLRNRNRYHNG